MAHDFLVPLVTPFREDETVDYSALTALVKQVLADGADGIYACGSSAEFLLLTDEERMRILETIVQAADGAHVTAHIANVGSVKTESLARHAAQAGANRLASVPPFYANFAFSEIEQYYRGLTAATALPFMIYTVPVSTNIRFGEQEYLALLSLAGIESIKFTDPSVYLLERVKTRSGKRLYSGCDEIFLSAVAAGADGAIGTTMNFTLKHFLAIDRYIKNGELSKALDMQRKLNAIISAMIQCGVINSTKYLMSLRGMPAGFARRPFSQELTKSQKDLLQAVYEENAID